MTKSHDFSKGRRGAVVATSGKTRITMMLDDEVLQHFRALSEKQGVGYQTLINSVLRSHVAASNNGDLAPLTVATLREILRQELQAA